MVRFRIWFAALPRVMRLLLVANVAAYAAWVVLLSHIPPVEQFVWDHLAFHSPWGQFLREPWQLVTYNFLHLGVRGAALGASSLLHVGFNMLWLYWIGRDFEETHGSERLLAVYLIAGVCGALLSALGYGLMGTTAVIHGASASVLGVVTMVAVMYPWRRIGLLFFGPVRLLHLVLIFLALDVLLGFGGDTAVLAHLGGAATGFALVRIESRGMDLYSWTGVLLRGPARGTPSSEGRGILGRLERRLAGRGRAPERERPSVDGILDKISEQGMDSLTEEELAILDQAGRR